jgi:hypothetical protein
MLGFVIHQGSLCFCVVLAFRALFLVDPLSAVRFGVASPWSELSKKRRGAQLVLYAVIAFSIALTWYRRRLTEAAPCLADGPLVVVEIAKLVDEVLEDTIE